ncbi:MAG: hypothetical protein GW903_01675 [Alphaproteobacteria bacterium]|nr:hypothetical protein [Alphaproteobacteria bacterium]NCQ87679.1 hypothetical protein [Alphaproteobacteria bacterium]NCT05812.1 hypothetical protein [Alphaproteobacteria bacterium]
MLKKSLYLISGLTSSLVLLNGCATMAMDKVYLDNPYTYTQHDTRRGFPQNLQCPQPPQPTQSMVFDSIYTDRSEGVSIVDEQAQTLYKKQISDIRDFEIHIVGWSNNLAKGKSADMNFCALTWMHDWAKRDALYGVEESFQGEALRKWALATISTQYSLLSQSVIMPPSDKEEIEDWIKALADQVMTDYARYPNNKSRNNNHMYWAAWGVMAAGFAVNEPEYFNWAVLKYKKGVADIQKDGTLPLELERQGRAFLYHNFALSPLIMMAETAAQNGVDLYGENNGAIHKLVKRVVTDLDSKQAYITAKSGKTQDMDGVVTSASLSWMAPYYKRYKTHSLKKWVKKYEPLKSSRLGGDLSYLFDVRH